MTNYPLKSAEAYKKFSHGATSEGVARAQGNVTVPEDGNVVARAGGSYVGLEIVQRRAGNLFRTSAGHAIIGSWIVGDQASGIGIREDAGLITTNLAWFVPHAIVG